MTEILQREETLDSCLIAGVCTFRNGCNFRLKIEKDGTPYLSYGCYGVHVNLAQGQEKLLMHWLEKNKATDGYARLNIRPETKMHLMKQRPCEVCGGLLMAEKEGS